MESDDTPSTIGKFIFETIEVFVKQGLTGDQLSRALGRAVMLRYLTAPARKGGKGRVSSE